MIELTYCLRRRSDLTWEQFSDYWREVHAPLVAERADTLGIRRYLQVRTMQDRPLIEGMRARNGASPEPFDGVAELWFDSIESFSAVTPEGRQAAAELLADERNFIDLERWLIWLGSEPVIDDDQ